MAAAERAIFEIVVDGAKAKAELEATRQSAESLGGAYDGLKLRVGKLSGEVDGYIQKSRSMADVAKQLQQRLGPQAAAISSIASALGDTNNAMGKAVNIAGQLAAAYAVGGPLGVGVAGLTALVTQLQKSWDEELLAQDRAIAARFRDSDKMIEKRKALEQLVADLDKTLHPETAAQAWERNTAAIYEAQGRLLVTTTQNEKRELDGLIKLLERRRTLENERFNKPAAAVTAPPKPVRAADSEGIGADLHGQITALLKVYDQEKKAKGQALKDEFELFDIEKKQEADRLVAARKAADELEKLDEERAKKHRESLAEIRKQEQDHFATIDGYYNSFFKDTLEAGVTDSVGYLTTYFGALSQHHKHAAEEAQAAFLQSVGGQLVGLGQRALFEGAEVLLTSHGLDPAGYGLVTLGGAAIAAGVGMGAAGAGISANVSALDAADSKAGQSDRGVNSGSRSGSTRGSGGLSLTVVNNYGAGGPPAEDTAREVVKAVRLADKRRFR